MIILSRVDMKALSEFKWMIMLILVLAACQKDEEVLPTEYCESCNAFKGVYELVLVVTPSCRYTPENQINPQGMVVIDGRVEVTEFGVFRQELVFWNGEGRSPDSTNTQKCSKDFLFEVVNDTTIKVKFDQCGRMYYNYAYFNDGRFRHEYSYQCNRYYQKID